MKQLNQRNGSLPVYERPLIPPIKITGRVIAEPPTSKFNHDEENPLPRKTTQFRGMVP